jgi:8-oxo-dGTP pyrophosphatase MutT (NUDIX family)
MRITEHNDDVNIRAGILIKQKGTTKILIEHATGHHAPNPCMDIPKGHITIDEKIEEGACREIQEETGIEIDPGDLTELGHFPYNKSTLYIFYVEMNFDINKCHCDSMFTSPSGKELPEVDGYELFDIVNDDLDSSLLYKGLKPILRHVFQDMKEKNLI